MKVTATTLATRMPVIEAAREHFEASIARGRGELDWSAIALTIAEEARGN